MKESGDFFSFANSFINSDVWKYHKVAVICCIIIIIAVSVLLTHLYYVKIAIPLKLAKEIELEKTNQELLNKVNELTDENTYLKKQVEEMAMYDSMYKALHTEDTEIYPDSALERFTQK